MVGELSEAGWARVGFDPALRVWAEAANNFAEHAMIDPMLAQWWVCENTWFVGVDALPNDERGDLPEGTRFPKDLKLELDARFGFFAFHKAQVSVVCPGYPKPREGESEAAFYFRQNRDAAHVDGLKPEGPERRRMAKEPHAYILGLPLNQTHPEAAPMVVWEGSHQIIRAALKRVFRERAPDDWGNIDVTEVYKAARREVFATCKRVPIHANPGEGYLLHRLCLHGVAPWAGPEVGDRRIAYFRPPLSSVRDWVETT